MKAILTALGGTVAAVAVCLCVAAPAHADDTTATVAHTADRVLTAQLARDHIPGAAVVVVAGGKQVYAKGYGVADTGRRTPVDPGHTSFYLGSVTKLFTATAVQQLVDAGKLDLDADVNSYLDFRIPDRYPGRPIRLRNLLTHTSGFEDEVLGLGTPTTVPPAKLGHWLATHQPRRVRPPGTLASYDNYGVVLAGYVVQRVSGESYQRYVRDHVLTPLGMRHTSLDNGRDLAPRYRSDGTIATGYRSDGTVATGGRRGPGTPAGPNVTAPPTDLGRYLIDQLKPGNPLLRRHFTQDPRLPGMGLVYEEHPRHGVRVISKDGDVPGYHDYLALLPDDDIGVYVAYNGDGVDGAADDDRRALVDRIVDALHPDRHPATPHRADDGDLSRYAGSYRTTRYNHDDLTKVTQLTSGVTVQATGTELTTTGLSTDAHHGEIRWIPLGHGLFAEQGGYARLAFRGDALFDSENPTMAYQRLAWYQAPMLHLETLVVAILVLLYAAVVWPVAALVQRREGILPTVARLAGWAGAVLPLVGVVLLGIFLSDGATVNEHVLQNDSATLHAAPVVFRLGTVFAGVLLVGAVLAWVRRWWRVPGRIGYTVVALAAVAFTAVAAVYNLTLS
ncbi:FmtA-like protein [Actinocatenispora thailandica]|uniref:FmtA-like protein n=1 Tax=Actinocatenispora thailandica TaxID=227318 RepID=A0A7R7HZU6_9ACTN|nr:serine hydrolase domain-containing protein [Actinocatenispora thailandica]BCJ38722.1 FmtA-like protein [Actinocatenispora thailandica]